jgi:flagellar hook-length control protein FliK
MGIASGAMGLLQRVMGHGNTTHGFEAQLQAALSGGPEAGAALFGQALQARETLDGELLAAITAAPQAMPLFQFLAALKSMGVGSDDARALLAGTPQGLSDEGLKAILASCGFKDADIAQIFADPAAVNDLKAKLAESISTRLGQQIGSGSADTGRLITMATTDQATYDAVVAQFIVSRGFRQGVPGTPEQPAAQATTTPSDITKIVSQIQESVAEVVKPPHAEGHHVLFTRPAQAPAVAAGTTVFSSSPAAVPNTTESAVQAAPVTASLVSSQPAAVTAPEVTAQVAAMVDTLEDTFNIPKGIARDLVFATDSQVRHAAVQEATARISAVLSAKADTELPRQAVDALGMLKGALSEEEFAGIETMVKTHTPEAATTLAPALFDKGMLEALARQLSDDAPVTTRHYTREVVDQIRQAVPAYAKTGEGSLTLRLNPPLLGRVDIDIRVEDGRVMASFKVDQPVTRDIIQQNMHVLKDALSEQGIKATQFVTTGSPWPGSGTKGTAAGQASREGSRAPGTPGGRQASTDTAMRRRAAS